MKNITQIFKDLFEVIKVNWKSALIALLYVVLGWTVVIASLIPFLGFPAIFLTPFFFAALGLTLAAVRGNEVKFGDILTPLKSKKFYFQAILLHVLMVITAPLWLIGVGLRWFLAPIVLAENPEMTAIEAMKKSAELMKGHKVELYLTLLVGGLLFFIPFVQLVWICVWVYVIIYFLAKYYDYVKA